MAEPREGEIRIDLTTKELVNICWLAHFGFKNMIKDESYYAFNDARDAEEATHAIEKIERHRPEDYRDPDDRYAQAINRHLAFRDGAITDLLASDCTGATFANADSAPDSPASRPAWRWYCGHGQEIC
jgi:hypothetical protein